MSSQFVRSTEAFGAAGELTAVWLLARVRSYMPRLMLETVEGLIAHGALVRPRQILTLVFGHSSDQRRQRPHCCGHPADVLSMSSFSLMLARGIMRFCLWVEQIGEIDRRAGPLHESPED